jgi:hypothetical protein
LFGLRQLDAAFDYEYEYRYAEYEYEYEISLPELVFRLISLLPVGCNFAAFHAGVVVS